MPYLHTPAPVLPDLQFFAPIQQVKDFAAINLVAAAGPQQRDRRRVD